MAKLRILHTADLHLKEKARDEGLRALRFILETARESEVGAVIFAGDFFDGPILLGELVNEVAEMLSILPCPLYIIKGTPSHDPVGSVEFFGKVQLHNGQDNYCHIFPASYQVVRPHINCIHPGWNLDPDEGDPCGHFSFLPAPTKSFLAQDASGSPEEINQVMQQKLRMILADFGAKAADSPRPHILVSHITVTGSETSTGQILLGGDVQVSVADLALANADYVALGHIHKAQKLGGNIYYAGSPYHQNFGELEEKGFNIVTFDRGNLENVEFIKTPSTPRQVIDAEIEGGKIRLLALPHTGADVRVRIFAPQHSFPEDLISQVQLLCAGAGSLKVESIPTAENRVRAAELSTAKSLREKLKEYSKVKLVDIPESAMAKADELEVA